MTLLLQNATVVPMTAEGPRWFRGSVGIAGNRIAFVSDDGQTAADFCASHPDCRTIDCTGRAVMPGLINTHCHAAMTLQRSRADDIALMEWLNNSIWPFEAQQTPDEIVLGMTLGIVELLLGGVTSFVDMYFHEQRCVETVERAGIRALLGCSYFDSNIDEALAEAEAALAAAASCSRVRIALAPHAPYTVSPENLRRSRAAADRLGVPLMIHLAETQDEARIVRERYGCTPTAALDRLGLLDDWTIAAHCVWVDDDDLEILARRGVTVSHNPQSNMKIASGTAPVARMVEKGVRVTLATDGPCSNNDLDLWEEMRAAAFLQKVSTGNPLMLPAWEVLRMATAAGARAMGYGDGELGVVQEGALADLIVIDLRKPHLQPLHNPVSNLVYCGKASDVETVIVDGRIVVEQRRIAGLDLDALYRQVAAAVERIEGAL